MAKSERKFGYKRSREALVERANSRGSGYDSYIKQGFKMYKVREGKNLIRILPPTWEDPDFYGYNIHVVYGIGPDNQSYLSLFKMKGAKDPIEEARRVAAREGDKDLIKQLTPKERVVMWVIDRQAEEEGPQVWAAPFTVTRDFASLAVDEDTKEVVWVDGEDDGCDIRFYREGTGMTTKYPAAKMRLMKPSPIHDNEKKQAEWLDFIKENPIPDCLHYYSYEHISAVFDGAAASGSKDDDDEPAPRRHKQTVADDDEEAPPRRQARKAEPEPEDDDDDEAPPPRRSRTKLNEPEDDDDAPPSRKGRKAEPEDDDEEPPPRSSRRAAAADDDDDYDVGAKKKGTGQSIRERLKERRTTAREPDDDGEDD